METGILGDRYEVRQQLGKKAGRQTLLARDLATQDLVVLKILRFSSDFEWDDLKLFEREAATLQNLSHPAIPRYLDFFELDTPDLKGFALVQTYIAAKSLGEHLSAGRTFGEGEVIQLAKDLLEILNYLHDRHPAVIHRDLKPSNILLGDRTGNHVGQVYLVDFGSVQTIAAREGGTITVVGTYGYMPPEQFGGRAVPASDLYSLGATLIYLVCGQHPADLPQKDLKLQFEQVVWLSPPLISWLQRLTEPSLDRRFSSAKEALRSLENPQLDDVFPLTIGKPEGSRVIVNQSTEAFKIVVPPLVLPRKFPILVKFIALLGGFLFSWTFFSSFLPGFSFTIAGLVLVSISIYFTFYILSAIFGEKRIFITQREISATYNLFNLKFKKSFSENIDNIVSVEYANSLFIKIPDSKNSYYKINPKLIIYSKDSEHLIGGDKFGSSGCFRHHFTDEEIEWIAKELGNWLGVPVRQRF